MIRTLIVCVAMALGASASLANDLFVQQVNYDRPGGAYVTVPVANVTACAAQCARDGLCLAWSFRPTDAQCALKAVVTPARVAPGVTSGLAARASRFAGLVGAELPARETPTEPPPAPAKPKPPPVTPKHVNTSSEELLGGPDDAL